MNNPKQVNKLINEESSKWNHLFTAVLIILIVNTGVFIVGFWNNQNQLETMETTITEQNNKIQDLENQLEIFDVINETGLMPWPTIYNQLKDSVVLIKTDLGLGSGFIYDTKGHIVTNYHVIESAENIEVTFLDGNISSAEIIGLDIYSDLAIIKVNPETTILKPVVLGSSSELIVGEPVAAMGNPYGLSDTITVGIVSSLQRSLEATGGYLIIDIIQIDAAINPGNSGGPLVNLHGQVVGLNTAIQSETGSFTGIGFAIPSDTIKREINDLIETGSYKHPWLGISGLKVNLALADAIGLDKPQGILVIDVTSGSPADLAGIRGSTETGFVDGIETPLGGDVIIEVDGIKVISMNDLAIYMEQNTSPKDSVVFTIIRDGQKIDITATLGQRPQP
ncbi:MAG: trypsin-like peptidase domain-containing protein [Candidatus Bathyarchaeota archaeon]|nr:MAG: trypsin-like peptidase domain-containing protein [Candidatus Bathyarchaeum tardum]WNZ28759.1 MAG: trypsin-like peptidase domain-containing protein [Candidatus Bathyarchaeota archaeon]